jgi:hypothetical protein
MKKQPNPNPTKTKIYGIYSVEDYPTQNGGKWGGFKVSVVDSSGQKQGRLYPRSDGREHYQKKPEEELEI